METKIILFCLAKLCKLSSTCRIHRLMQLARDKTSMFIRGQEYNKLNFPTCIVASNENYYNEKSKGRHATTLESGRLKVACQSLRVMASQVLTPGTGTGPRDL